MSSTCANLFRRVTSRELIFLLGLTTAVTGPGIDTLAPASMPGSQLFTQEVVCQIRIALDSKAMGSLRENPRKFVAATVSEKNITYSPVAVHLKGAVGTFRAIDDQPSLTLDFDRFKTGQRFHGLRRIHLNNSLEDPSFVNEKIGSELFRAAGVPAPRVMHALVTLNGRGLGLYVLKEGFTEDFLAGYFRQVGGDLYEPENGGDVGPQLKRLSLPLPTSGPHALTALAEAAREPDLNRRWRRLESVLDTKRFLAFMAMEVMLGHRDGYSMARNNYRVYHDLETGKIVFFPQGMDQLLGTPDLPWQPSFAGLVAAGVMSTPEGKQLYEASFGELFTNLFQVTTLTRRVDQIVQDLRPFLSHNARLHLNQASAQVKERLIQRQTSLQAQLSRPPLKRMNFASGTCRLDGWLITEKPDQGKMDLVTESDGQPALYISTSTACAASWSTKALVQRGRYRFEGRGRVASVQPLRNGRLAGARLRIRGFPGPGESLMGDSPWKLMAVPFQVKETTQEVEFVCELRAEAGEAWFDVNSLQVTRLGDL